MSIKVGERYKSNVTGAVYLVVGIENDGRLVKTQMQPPKHFPDVHYYSPETLTAFARKLPCRRQRSASTTNGSSR